MKERLMCVKVEGILFLQVQLLGLPISKKQQRTAGFHKHKAHGNIRQPAHQLLKAQHQESQQVLHAVLTLHLHVFPPEKPFQAISLSQHQVLEVISLIHQGHLQPDLLIHNDLLISQDSLLARELIIRSQILLRRRLMRRLKALVLIDLVGGDEC